MRRRFKIIERTSEDMVVDRPQPVLNVCCQSKDTLCVKKVDFVVIFATVINCTAQFSKKSKKLDIIVAAAEKFLGLKDFTSEDLQGVLSPEDPPSQVQICKKFFYLFVYWYFIFL
ncbi:hypothetical protein J4Q44_G00007830 [Coregonus suidteri]|uniref:Uncharacterized protein n=1 Tax=Coregonus suidteri TaxID=861788 RepID=A0AAN8R6Z8_9TELE